MLRAELHVHSSFSDGKDSVKSIVKKAILLKIDLLSITDHDTVAGSLEAIDYVGEENLDIMVIPGVEVTTSDGHLLVFGVEREIERKMTLKETVDLARKLGGICVIPHPFQFERKGVMRAGLFRYVDGIEVFNAKYFVGIFNWIARKYTIKYSKPFTAGSDAHSTDEMGYGITLFDGDLYSSLEERKTEIDGKKLPLGVWIKSSFKRRFSEDNLP